MIQAALRQRLDARDPAPWPLLGNSPTARTVSARITRHQV